MRWDEGTGGFRCAGRVFWRVVLTCWVVWSAQLPLGQVLAQTAGGKQAAGNGVGAKKVAGSESGTKEITIASEPRTIAPTEVLPKPLTVRATADFSDSSLREFVDWLEKEQKLVVLLNQRALADAGLSVSEPISDRLDNEPLYLILNRLRIAGIGWYYDDDVLHLTAAASLKRLTTMPHEISELLVAGYDQGSIDNAIRSVVGPRSWNTTQGEGTLSFLGDVMFVRQADWRQYQIQGLLRALRKPAERTYVLEPARHLLIRGKLEVKSSVSLKEVPLVDAVAKLSQESGIDMRLDPKALNMLQVRPRQPVTISIRDRDVRTILDAVLLQAHLQLRWVIEDGTLWITSSVRADRTLKIAAYDVRDLCRDYGEAMALRAALLSQTSREFWSSTPGEGGLMQFGGLSGGELGGPTDGKTAHGGTGPGVIDNVRAGTMLIYATEPAHDAVLALLRSYRHALRSTKRRKTEVAKDEVVTVYYRVSREIAADLRENLPRLVGTSIWSPDQAPAGAGEILEIASTPEAMEAATDEGIIMLPQSVLVIRHLQSVHREIEKVIGRIAYGDGQGRGLGLPGGMGGGFGGGGFGGGLLQVPAGK